MAAPTRTATGMDIVLGARLDGVCLVEASAGTGKTWTIAGLYLRLVIERGLRPEQILVVSFTDAATAELRGRIRAVLAAALAAFEAGEANDPLLAALLSASTDHEAARTRLRHALQGFDLAAIQTIHGFCARVLAESAFEAALPFETELLPDQGLVVADVAADFWRRELAAMPGLLVRLLLLKRLAPASLQARLGRYLAQSGTLVDRPPDVDVEELAAQIERVFAALNAAWQRESAELHSVLATHSGLAHKSYTRPNVARWVARLDALLASGDVLSVLTGERKLAERFSTAGIDAARKPGAGIPEFAVPARMSELLALAPALAAALAQFEARFLAFARETLPARKREQRVHGYEDLLLGLHDALAGRDGRRLAALLRQRFPAALIDEFQDTDPVQYGIFSHIYAEAGTWFMVGDPKQAIYSFRGADVFAYLRGREAAAEAWSLGQNWRSVPPLIEALNACYGRLAAPFMLDAIDYTAVTAAPRDDRPPLRLGTEAPVPLVFWFLARDGAPDAALMSKGRASEAVAAATAEEIARLLHAGEQGEAGIGDRALEGGDIAVLVRTNRQGACMRAALERLGIPVVELGKQNVFDSHEADELELLLHALLLPGHGGRLRAALGTAMLGCSLAEIAALAADDGAWQAWIERFAALHDTWQQSGPLSMFEQLARTNGVYDRLLGLADGERRLTNLRHLLELLQAAAREGGFGLERQWQWFRRRRAGEDRDTETEQLRLESDERLVQIVTVHRAKGLQYPIVFCPFLWDGTPGADRGEPFIWHDPARDLAPVLDLGSEQRGRAHAARLAEARAEGLRLAYVALTRAVYRCYLVWGGISQAEHSPLAWLLHGPAEADAVPEPAAFAGQVKDLDDTARRAVLDALAEAVPGAVQVTALPSAPAPKPLPPDPGIALAARSFRATLPVPWRMTSFTALTRRAGHGNALVELPDHDAGVIDATDAEPGGQGIFAFPRGANAGTCLHAILEHADFTRPQSLSGLSERALQAHGIDTAWAGPVSTHLARVLATPLDGSGLRLADIGHSRRLNEMEFTFPVCSLAPERLAACLGRFGIDTPDFAVVSGYLKGFIDLVFEHDGRFYIVDYKSNWLGGRTEDYGRARMAAVMAAEHYRLQYLLYTVALMRYLRLRLPAGNDRDCFGGVFYLFLRGMTPASPAGTGIWFDRPEPALVEALGEVFDGH